jgi:hypothetical protein
VERSKAATAAFDDSALHTTKKLGRKELNTGRQSVTANITKHYIDKIRETLN